MNQISHHIYKQVVDFAYGDEHTAQQIQQRWSGLCNNELAQMTDELLTRLFPGDKIVKINTIVIDAGTLHVKQTNREWAEIICSKLEKELLKIAVPQFRQSAIPEDDRPATNPDDLQVLSIYLQSGSFPAWANLRREKDYHNQLLARLLDDQPEQLLSMIKNSGESENVRKRLAWFFSENVLNLLTRKLASENANEVFRLIEIFEKKHKKTGIYLAVLTSLIATPVGDFDLQCLLNDVVRHFNTTGKGAESAQLKRESDINQSPEQKNPTSEELTSQLYPSISGKSVKNRARSKKGLPLQATPIDEAQDDFGASGNEETGSLQQTGVLSAEDEIDLLKQPEALSPINKMGLLHQQSVLSVENEKILAPIQKAIRKKVANAKLRQLLNGITSGFLLKMQSGQGVDPVSLLKNLIVKYSEQEHIKPRKLISQFYKSLDTVNLKGRGQTLIDAAYILDKTFKNKLTHKVEINDDDYEQDAEQLLSYLDNFSLQQRKSAGDFAKYIHKMGLKYPGRLKQTLSLLLQQQATRERLVTEADEKIILAFIQLKYPDNKTIKYYVKKAAKWFLRIQNVNDLPVLFWRTTINYAAENHEFAATDYISSLASAAATAHSQALPAFIKNQLKLLSKNNTKGQKLKLVTAALRVLKQQQLKENGTNKTTDPEDEAVENDNRSKDQADITTDQSQPINDEVLTGTDEAHEINLLHETGDFYIHNAGLVLLHPFIVPFLERLHILKDGKFETIRDKFRAVHALQYLVTGSEQHQEYELTIQKLICGMAISEVCEPQEPLSEQDKETAESLLRHVIQLWTIIGNTSVEGLREAFLQRTGKLIIHDDAIYLHVEQKAYDMLLDKLPWSISIVKFSWMPKPVNTIWR